jgi:hypothetical protein
MLLAEARRYADEIVVGVDAASQDDTWDVACAAADRVFRFRHGSGVYSPARMAGLERASCDWVLFLDDDEGMDELFPDLRDELLGDPNVTNWFLPRKWVIGLDPPRHLAAEPWYPDLVMRLVRADTTRVWKPVALHSGLRAIGPTGHETRTAILHYERIDRMGEERARKLATYASRGQEASSGTYYVDPRPDARTAPVEPAPLRDPSAIPPPTNPAVDEEVDDLDSRQRLPGWCAELRAQMPSHARPGEVVVAEVVARNTGTMRWVPPWSTLWPRLGLAYRVHRDCDTSPLPDAAERTPVGREVAPGGELHFLARCRVPDEPGTYVISWDLVSELEHWFSELGSTPARCTLTVA